MFLTILNYGNGRLTLKQFMIRGEVIKLYRNILRQTKKLPNKVERNEIKDWARADFEKNRHHTDEYIIRSLLLDGNKQLRELEKAINISKS